MSALELRPVDVTLVREAVSQLCASDTPHHQIQEGNAAALKDFAMHGTLLDTDFVRVMYPKGAELVHGGKIVSDTFQTDERLTYAYVPLGLIVHGEVIVMKGGKATKRLEESDFLGLFETADFLGTGRSREIGDWTLTAHTDTEVLYFSKDVLMREGEPHREVREYLIELARTDHVPKPLTSLPLLDWVADHVTDERLHDSIIIGYMHMLPNSFPLFRHLSSIVDFGKIYAIEKPYSTVKSTLNELVWAGFEIIPLQIDPGMPYEFAVSRSVQALWKKVLEDKHRLKFKNIIIVDDGADILLSIPWEQLEGIQIAGVQQTASGTVRIMQSPFRLPPIVNVASSGIKKIIESRFIGASVVEKLFELTEVAGKRVGILGMGNIGEEVAKSLRRKGIAPVFYDPKYAPGTELPEGARPSIDVLLDESDIIIGTAGADILKGIPFERVRGTKVLASASSKNVEFESLIKFAEPTRGPFDTIDVSVHEGLTFKILNGGYPINFDRVKDTTPDEDIVLTRAMLYAATIQAATLIRSGALEHKVYALDKVTQARMLEHWIGDKKARGQDPELSAEEIPAIVAYEAVPGAVDMDSVWRE